MEANSASFFARNEFLIRRLHSLSGLLPVGAYMCIHLLTNASTLGGAKMFQQNVDLIHSLGPALPLVEWSFIFIPLLFHAVVGVVIIRSGNPNLSSYHYVGNFRYVLQRATAWIALFFIVWHVFHMHGWFHNSWWLENVANDKLGGHRFNPEAATSTAALALASPLRRSLYFVGVISCVFHFANGLWTMGITWGVWTTAGAQKRANWICGAIGIALTVVGLSALAGVVTTDVKQAEAYEKVREEMREEETFRVREEELRSAKSEAAPSNHAATVAPAAASPSGTPKPTATAKPTASPTGTAVKH